MSMNEEAAMKSSKRTGAPLMSAAISATERARIMALTVGGPRPFGETKEAYCARLSRKLAFNYRRVRALLNPNEKLKLTAEEYVRIEALYLGANEAVASLSHLASEAEVRADRASGPADGNREEVGGRTGEAAQRAAAGPAVRTDR
jgi:hypothetical protein